MLSKVATRVALGRGALPQLGLLASGRMISAQQSYRARANLLIVGDNHNHNHNHNNYNNNDNNRRHWYSSTSESDGKSDGNKSGNEQNQQTGGAMSPLTKKVLVALVTGTIVWGCKYYLKDRLRPVVEAEATEWKYKRVIQDLKEILGEEGVDVSYGARQQHGKDFSYHEPHLPDVVVFPTTQEQVQAIVQLCNSKRIPIIAYGGGTSLEGHTSALKGGVTINFMKMNKILKLNVEDMDVTVQPGISYIELNEELKDTGLFFPMDPGPGACIGGMVGTSCSGTHAVRYGTMKDNVLSLNVVLPNGKVVKTGSRAKKSSAGYDLTHLFIGSEGTLGIVTEITLKLKRRPEKLAVAVCNFDTARDAAKAVIQTIQAGVQIGRAELLDKVQIKAVNLTTDLNMKEENTLFFEFSGTPKQVDEQIQIVEGIVSKLGRDFRFAVHEEERERLWQARKVALWAAPSLRPGSDVWITDVCVPISRLADIIELTEEDLSKSPLLAPMVSHAGDGNFHLFILFNAKDPAEYAEAKRINENLVKNAIAMEGTCTGEHGVGFGKRDYLVAEHGPEAVELMHKLKKAIDKRNILNPGKVLPPP